MSEQIVIIGAGHGGGELAVALKEGAFEGNITLVGAEPHAPYQRPPLSKGYLRGKVEAAHLYLKNESYWGEGGLALIAGAEVVEIDREAARVRLADGRTIAYDMLAIATGARPRALSVPGAELEGVHLLRTIDDADALRPRLAAGGRVVIIGGGYIGLEVAATARLMGAEVTVVEQMPRLMARVASEALSERVRAIHEGRGVVIRLNARVTAIEGRARVEAVVLEGGERIAADVVLVGIGVVPNQVLAERAGLEVGNGIIVDAYCRTSDAAIHAFGDVAEFPDPLYGRIRLESVQNAVEQAKAVAKNLSGQGAPYEEVPWFWSDQYQYQIQMAGLPVGVESTVWRPGRRPETGSVWCYRGGRLIAVEAIADPRAYMTGRRLIAAGRSPAPDEVADPARDLKTLI